MATNTKKKKKQKVDPNEPPKAPPTAIHVLESLGIDEPWKVALLIPETYEDVAHPVTDPRNLVKEPAPFAFTVAGPMSTSASRGVPRTNFPITDVYGGTWQATVFGPTGAWAERVVPGAAMVWMASGKPYGGGGLSITLKEPIEPEYTGQVRPTYPHRRSRRPREYIRKTVRSYLPQAIGPAAAFVREQLKGLAPMDTMLADLGCPGWTLEQVLKQVHAPQNIDYARHARQAYLSLAALGGLTRMHAGSQDHQAAQVYLATLARRIETISYTLTADQHKAVHEVAGLLARGVAMRHLVAGEVGSGKTLVASLLLACVADTGLEARALVMAPNATLAGQFKREFERDFPGIDTALVTGDAEGTPELPRKGGPQIIFGTSAVIHRDMGTFDLVVVDEQQNWSREQREHYVHGHTHLLELSATCIPRTQALIRYGRITISQMRQCHKPKNIQTRMWEGRDHVRTLMNGIRGVVDQGRPVIVVYPKREEGKPVSGGSGAPGIDPRYSVELAYDRWDKQFPGKVRAITSDDDAEGKRKAIQDLESGRANILLATTVVQVGLNIKGLRNMVIASPERHGLTALHQLRGRLARNGGDGYCDLLVTSPLSEKTRERLGALMSTTDGFVLAEMDLDLRGSGDLGSSSKAQSGADQTFLYGIPMTPDLVEGVRDLWMKYATNPSKTSPMGGRLKTGHSEGSF